MSLYGLLFDVGLATRRLITQAGGMAILSAQAIYFTFTRPFCIGPIVQQMELIGIKSLGIVSITALFTGMVLGLQTAYGLARFGAKYYIGGVVSLSIVREMGPVLTALVVGGRVGSGMAAELGSMSVTEQIDAMRAIGDNPIKGLVVPRIVACILALPLLTAVADLLGILGGLIISLIEVEDSFFLYFQTVRSSLLISDVLSGIFKTLFFGFIVAIVGCYQGLSTKGGTRGVGTATTVTVVTSFLMILVADFVLTKIFLAL